MSSPVGVNSGNQMPPSSSNCTCTGVPTSTSSGSHPTMLVVRNTRGSSSSATDAITYGGGNIGSHCWWFTVTPTTVPRPLTSTTDRLLDRQ